MTLKALQQTMATSILKMDKHKPLGLALTGNRAEECLHIYQNHYLISLTDAITATFPVTKAYLGEALFNKAAQDYIFANPPSTGCLAEYGQNFPVWLGQQNTDMHRAIDLAALEWLLERVGMVSEPKAFPFHILAELPPDEYKNVHFHLASGVSVFSSNWDVVSLYDQISRLEEADNAGSNLTFNDEFHWLIYRKLEGVGIYPADKYILALLQLCQSGQALSAFDEALCPEHIQALFVMVEHGIIDSFDTPQFEP